MIRSIFSLAIFAVALFAVAPTAQAVVTDAQFSGLVARMQAMQKELKKVEEARKSDATITAQVLNAQADEIKKLKVRILVLEEEQDILLDHILIDDQGTPFDLDDDTIQIIGGQMWVDALDVYALVAYSGSFGGPVTASDFLMKSFDGKVALGIFSALVYIRGTFEALGVNFEMAPMDSPTWRFNDWITRIQTVLLDEPCQPAYDTCDDGDPCTEDWCSPQSSTCQHQLAQECSGM